MGVPLLLQFSIALFTGMVAATFVPPVRRSIPRVFEVMLWIALLTVCGVGIVSITDPNARELSASVAWGADQLINTAVGLLTGGVVGWISANRFALASWTIIVAGIDIFAIALLRSRRAGRGWQPRVRLREWMELPTSSRIVQDPLPVSDPIGDLNRKVAGGMAIAGTTLFTKALDVSIWIRDVKVPRETGRIASAAKAGRAQSRARLESVRDAAAHVQYATRAWYAAAGEPAVNRLAARATDAIRVARDARRGLNPVGLTAAQVIDIQALLSAQSIGWYGPLTAGPASPLEGGNDDAESQQRSDRLAS